MQLHQLRPKTKRSQVKRVGRGGKRGTTSDHGTKGQKGRAGASVKPGFRGGDNRIWQAFPKQRGASKKHGNSRPHRKHRFYQYRQEKAYAVNVGQLNAFSDGTIITLESLFQEGLIENTSQSVKILGDGILKRKLTIQNVPVSKSAAEKIASAGGTVESAQ